jgi:hypothetical protein
MPALGRGRVRLGLLRAVRVSLAWLIFTGSGSEVAAQGNASGEYQVKAAFLFHFAQFVDWPAGAFKEADSPVVYCTIGEDPFHGALDASLSGKMIGTRPSRVQHFKQPQDVQGCQVLFIGTLEKKLMFAELASLKGNPVLTVGESEHFAQEGGMIGFCLEDNKVRFEINLTAAERANLKISARLLALAKTVIGAPKGG